MQNPTPRYHFNKANLEQALWTLVHLLIAVIAYEVIDLLGHFDFGQYTPMVVVLLAFASKLAGQYLGGNPCTNLTITGTTTPTITTGNTTGGTA